MKTQLPNGLCDVPDGYEEISVYARCFLGYDNAYTDGVLTGCTPCGDDEYTIVREEGLICGHCASNEFRHAAHCVEFTDENCAMDFGKSMHASPETRECLCEDGTLPLFSLGAQMYICDTCKEGLVPVPYNGAGLPSFLCHEENKTLFNTSCLSLTPLNETTGLCMCG